MIRVVVWDSDGVKTRSKWFEDDKSRVALGINAVLASPTGVLQITDESGAEFLWPAREVRTVMVRSQ